MGTPERRRHDRYACRFSAELYILFPEETFRPHPYLVTVIDVSQSGSRVVCPSLSVEEYRMLLSSIRFARLVVRCDQKTARLYARIVWIEQRSEGPDKKIYHLGIAFESRTAESSEDDVELVLEKAKLHSITRDVTGDNE